MTQSFNPSPYLLALPHLLVERLEVFGTELTRVNGVLSGYPLDELTVGYLFDLFPPGRDSSALLLEPDRVVFWTPSVKVEANPEALSKGFAPSPLQDEASEIASYLLQFSSRIDLDSSLGTFFMNPWSSEVPLDWEDIFPRMFPHLIK